jgi:iron complex transport system ATP-binding protein
MTTPFGSELVVKLQSVVLSGREVLGPMSFECVSGQHTVVLGPNGAGKTTLMRALLGLCPFEGSVRVQGREFTSLSPVERARLVAYVPQRSQLSAALSVEEVVMQGRFAHHGNFTRPGADERERVRAVLGETDLLHLATRSFQRLSGGEQRRVLLARALATEASVICLDEPTAFLDLSHALELFHLLSSLRDAGRTIVSVLHDLHDARRWADRALVLHQGRLRYEGSADVPREVIQEVYGVLMHENQAPSFSLQSRGTPE